MPIYEYFCPKCEIDFEVRRPLSEASEPASCPKCNEKAERLISVFASKSGFYITGPEKGAFRKREKKEA